MTMMADSAAYIQLFENIRNAKLVAVVAITSLLWHYLNTFSQESVIFPSFRSAFQSHCCFDICPLQSCRAAAMFTGVTTLIVIALCDIILVIRVWAIYERRGTTLCLLILGLFVTTVPMFVLGLRWLMTVDVSNDYAPYPTSGCFLTSTAIHQYWEMFPFTLAFNSILFLMILWKSLGHYKLETRTPITTLLIRDGVLYYLVILVALLLTGFGVFIQDLRTIAMQSGVLISVLSITCSQMQINLRGALASNQICTTFHHNFYRCQCGGEITEDVGMPEIEFLSPITPLSCRRPSHRSGCVVNRHHSDCVFARHGRDIGLLEAILGGFSDTTHGGPTVPSPPKAPERPSRTVMLERRWSDLTIPLSRRGSPIDGNPSDISGPPGPLSLDLNHVLPKPSKARVKSAPPPPRHAHTHTTERLSFASSPRPSSVTYTGAIPLPLLFIKSGSHDLTDGSITMIESPESLKEAHPSSPSQAGLQYYLQHPPLPLYGQGFISPIKL